jgi:hypothetical protein
LKQDYAGISGSVIVSPEPKVHHLSEATRVFMVRPDLNRRAEPHESLLAVRPPCAVKYLRDLGNTAEVLPGER